MSGSENELLAKLVWAGVVTRTEQADVDEDPEAVIERVRRNRYTPATLAEELGVIWPVRQEILDAAAWAGKALWSLMQRDRAIRIAVAEGCPSRVVGQVIGLSHEGVRRIVAREGATNTRW